MADRARVSELLMLGHDARARKLHDTLNHIDVCFGGEAQPLPPPARQFTGLIYADASKVTPAQFMRAVRPLAFLRDEQLTETLGDPLYGVDFDDEPVDCGHCSETLEADGSCSLCGGARRAAA